MISYGRLTNLVIIVSPVPKTKCALASPEMIPSSSLIVNFYLVFTIPVLNICYSHVYNVVAAFYIKFQKALKFFIVCS